MEDSKSEIIEKRRGIENLIYNYLIIPYIFIFNLYGSRNIGSENNLLLNYKS